MIGRAAPLVLLAMAAPGRDKQSPAERFFDTRVAPILNRRCVGCHNPQLNNGGLSILERESLLKGGTRGPAVLPGRPERSLLIETLRHEGAVQMPPGPKLPAKEIRVLTDWIRGGAVWGTKLRGDQ